MVFNAGHPRAKQRHRAFPNRVHDGGPLLSTPELRRGASSRFG
jgi:hypothetical protein